MILMGSRLCSDHHRLSPYGIEVTADGATVMDIREGGEDVHVLRAAVTLMRISGAIMDDRL
jgi:hypothetical protein